MANFITIIRILCSFALLFCTPLSLPFYALYTAAGLSDIFDGLIARKTNTATKLIKLVNIMIGFIRRHTLTAVHSVINKVTGGLLFILPFTLTIIDIRYTAPLVCIVATVAAIMESRTVIIGEY